MRRFACWFDRSTARTLATWIRLLLGGPAATVDDRWSAEVQLATSAPVALDRVLKRAPTPKLGRLGLSSLLDQVLELPALTICQCSCGEVAVITKSMPAPSGSARP